ncbi:ferredoxin [Micromonospora sp. NPDC049101]|uniref:ferredoxin n=1 Tax=unclassified Micromonospora TaxID=2617518 RepID=UPI0033DE9815
MRIRVDADRCVASGVCAFTAPEVFDQGDEDGVVRVLQAEPPADQHEAVEEAVLGCPAQVITIE